MNCICKHAKYHHWNYTLCTNERSNCAICAGEIIEI